MPAAPEGKDAPQRARQGGKEAAREPGGLVVYIRGLGRVETTYARVRAWTGWLNSPAGKIWQDDLRVKENQALDYGNI